MASVQHFRTRISWPLLLAGVCLLGNALAVVALGTRGHTLHRLAARLQGRQSGTQELTQRTAMPPASEAIQVRFVAQTHNGDVVNAEDVSIGDYITNVEQSVRAAIAESASAANNEGTGADGPKVLHVLLGAEWRIRKTMSGKQFGKKDFKKLVKHLNKLSAAHRSWVLAPGTMLFDLDANSFGSKIASVFQDTMALIVNCLPVSYQGKTHVVCKKNECDLINPDKHQWAYEELEGGSFGTVPYTAIQFQEQTITIGVDICLDSSSGRLLTDLDNAHMKNTIDIYLVSADGGLVTPAAEQHVLANGALALAVNVMHGPKANTYVSARGKDFDDGSIHRLGGIFEGTTGPDPVKQPILVYAPVALPFYKP